jgi:putative nucleotidyltransferase with HDIG domain
MKIPGDITHIAYNFEAFPPLPAVVNRIMQIVADRDSSCEDLRRVVEVEVAFASSILKMANSPFFGRSRKIVSLDHAISLLGMNEIQNLILSKTMFQSFKLTRRTGFNPTPIWKHSFYCGLASKIIGKRLALDQSECFVAGLIHDLGKLLFTIHLPEESLERLEYNTPASFGSVKREKQLLGLSHDELGMKLVSSWMFPHQLVNAVAYHHCPREAPENDIQLAIVVHLADLISHYHDTVTAELDPSLISELLFSSSLWTLCEPVLLLSKENIMDIIEEVSVAAEAEAEFIDLLNS